MLSLVFNSTPSQSPRSYNLRVSLPKDEHGAVGKDLPRPISLLLLLLLQIFLLLTELEVVAVNVVHWCGKINTCMYI